MCSRFSQTLPPEAVRAYFGYRNLPNFPARYNIAPTQPIPVVRQTRERGREFVLMRWGLIPRFLTFRFRWHPCHFIAAKI